LIGSRLRHAQRAFANIEPFWVLVGGFIGSLVGSLFG
jgi:hypothetical protein